MNSVIIVYAVIIGLIVLAASFLITYGALVFWSEYRKRTLPLIMIACAAAMIALYAVTVIGLFI